MSDIQRGIISGYDAKSMTAVVTSYEGDVYNDVVCPIERFDTDNNSYGMKPPSIGAPCLFTISGEEVFILTMFPPGNVADGSSADHDNPYDNSVNRAPSNAKTGVLPGETSNTNSLGGEESFSDTCKKIIMSPGKLSTVWNLANFTWDTVCNLLSIRSGSMDLTCGIDGSNGAKTTFSFKQSVGESPGVVTVNIGSIGDGVLNIKINNQEFLTVDAERNVRLTAKKIDVTAENINYCSQTFNCQNVDKVDLP